jgi:hypothetical protein
MAKQNIKQKTKDRVTRTPLKPRVNQKLLALPEHMSSPPFLHVLVEFALFILSNYMCSRLRFRVVMYGSNANSTNTCKNGGELMCSGRASSFWSTRRVSHVTTPVISHEGGKDRIKTKNAFQDNFKLNI